MAVKFRTGMKAKIKRNIENIRKEFPPSEYKMVLDVGTKEGYGVYWFRKFGYNATGIEFEKGYSSDTVLEGDFLEMPLLNDFQDIVFSRHSLEHIVLENDNGTEKFLKKSYEILRSGGILYIIVPILQWAEFEFKSNFGLIRIEPSFDRLCGMLEDNGFEIIKKRCRENALIIGRKL